ncbi:hypothetical protein TH66_21410 [Carbonactinospora thermoautotrophica]|uniref:HTH cro/C1-type domain-containing protein n=1 Tax=Carbonactinospora thermoautotrophica TaxID=1469144 RepID=A0A132MJ88_9ACTN|nr:hypothetical protein TH66_21410 [Carbonactinospora thermoautotrophica]KWX09351.1 hypothetical protein TR74_10095 [Carbonactinospora thermoautotrophica]
MDVIRKLEQHQRHSARLSTIGAIARALDVDPAELVGRERGLGDSAEDSEMYHLRRATLDLIPYPDEPLPDLAVLDTQVRDLWDQYWVGRYGYLARALPALVTQVRATAQAAAGGNRVPAHATLASVLQLMAALLTRLAHEDLAHIALADATRAAEVTGDELLHASQQAARVWLLSCQGLHTEAEQLAVDIAHQVEPALSRDSADRIAVWGELLRYATHAAAGTPQREAEARELQRLVSAAAEALGPRQPTIGPATVFSPTVAGMNGVTVCVELDDPRTALTRAAQVESPESAPPAIQVRYLLAVAMAQTMTWDNQAAVDTLLRAEQISAELMRHMVLARTVVEELLPRRRTQRLPGLTSLAGRLGIKVHE